MQAGGESSVPPRVAVVLQGDPTDPRAWSGIPAGVSSGLTAAGAEPVPIDARFPGSSKLARVLRMSWIDEATNPLFAAAAGLSASVSIATKGRIDGAIAIGSGYALPARVPAVTFEDMTVAQALAQPGPTYAEVGEVGALRWRERQRRNYARSRACCVASDWAAGSIRDDYGIDAGKIHVVGFGRNAEAQRVDRDWSVPRYVFVGIDWERKRGGATVEAFSEVRKRIPEATLDLIGGHPPVDAPGVTGYGVLSLGSTEGRRRQAALLARATCLVMPSMHEPFGIAYVDAGAAGVPSIGTTAGGAADAVGDGGVLVAPGDRRALVEAMLELANPDTARRLGERARAHSELFTWKAVAERLLRALRPPGLDLTGLAEFL